MRTAGARTRAPARPSQARQRAWQSMRILRRFTVADLAATAEIGVRNARAYVRALAAASYLRAAAPVKNGHPGGHAVWLLIHDSGPHAPRLQTDGRAWDPNTDTVHAGGRAP